MISVLRADLAKLDKVYSADNSYAEIFPLITATVDPPGQGIDMIRFFRILLLR